MEERFMCGRYAFFTQEENQEIREIIEEINERYREEAPKMKTGEIFPTDYIPVITASTDNKKNIKLFKWGFPNFKQPGKVIINARSETVHEKPTFRNLLFTQRCLVPASGFYEWKAAGEKAAAGKKEKYFIRTSKNGLMYMAGLYNSYIDKNGIPFTGFVIITTEANEQMSQIHDRMPVILSGPESEAWINTKYNRAEDVLNILKPYNGNLFIEKAG